MSDDLDEALMDFGLNRVEGPTEIQPPPPSSYWTCRGCKYFKKSMAHSGGLRGAPTYFKRCIHPAFEDIGGRSWDTGLNGRPTGVDEKTPKWCPVLNQNEPVDISDNPSDTIRE